MTTNCIGHEIQVYSPHYGWLTETDGYPSEAAAAKHLSELPPDKLERRVYETLE